VGDDFYVKLIDRKDANEVIGQSGFWIFDEN
jgi:hypothetical protein